LLSPFKENLIPLRGMPKFALLAKRKHHAKREQQTSGGENREQPTGCDR
jgi:hypothetical protein